MAIPTNLKKSVFPMRPAKGGKLELSRPKGDDWVAQAKVNGQRITTDKKNGDCHSRYGEAYKHSKHIEPALGKMKKLFPKDYDLLDCETMYGRTMSNGAVIVLDSMTEGDQQERRKKLEKILPIMPRNFEDIQPNEVYLVEEVTGSMALEFYNDLKDREGDLFEGVVMKKKNSKYQVGRNSNDANYAWVKHRFDQ